MLLFNMVSQKILLLVNPALKNSMSNIRMNWKQLAKDLIYFFSLKKFTRRTGDTTSVILPMSNLML